MKTLTDPQKKREIERKILAQIKNDYIASKKLEIEELAKKLENLRKDLNAVGVK